jgi:hypothetical protein
VTALFDLCVRLEPVADVVVSMRSSKHPDA